MLPQQEGKKSLPLIKAITEVLKDGIQYLAGYVIQKLIKNAKKLKSTYGLLDVLEHMVTDTSMQKLIQIQSRGGLTAAILEANQIFFKAEEIFRAHTTTGLQQVKINNMIEELFQDVDLISIFNTIMESAGKSHTIDVDIKNNVLITMLKLYLRVRTFSLSPDIIARHRQELKVKKANKGIRKTLKEYTNKSKCDT